VLGSSAAAFNAHIAQAKQVWDNIAREAAGQSPLPTPSVPIPTRTPSGTPTPRPTRDHRYLIPLVNR
jgi:hypothetical protein